MRSMVEGSARSVVESRFLTRASDAGAAPSTALRAVPLPSARGGSPKCWTLPAAPGTRAFCDLIESWDSQIIG